MIEGVIYDQHNWFGDAKQNPAFGGGGYVNGLS
jgi:hypothetical protein